MSYEKETARFHVETGPASLFERVRFIMDGKDLKLHGDHFNERADERSVPIGEVDELDAEKWEAMLAEVNVDSGKFVSSSWRRTIDGTTWWIVIGLHNTVMTVFESDSKKLGSQVVRGGDLYEHTRKVNRRLMQQETQSEA
jgi:hypothetical protein